MTPCSPADVFTASSAGVLAIEDLGLALRSFVTGTNPKFSLNHNLKSGPWVLRENWRDYWKVFRIGAGVKGAAGTAWGRANPE